MALYSACETRRQQRSTRNKTSSPIALLAFPFPDPAAAWVTVRVLMAGPTRVTAGYVEKRMLVRQNGGLVVVGAIETVHDRRDPVLDPAEVDVAAVGTDLVVTVRGLSGSWVDWWVEVEAWLH